MFNIFPFVRFNLSTEIERRNKIRSHLHPWDWRKLFSVLSLSIRLGDRNSRSRLESWKMLLVGHWCYSHSQMNPLPHWPWKISLVKFRNMLSYSESLTVLDTNENMKCLNIRTFVQSAVNTIKNSTLTLYNTWLSMFDWVSMSVLGFVRVLNDVAQSSKQSLMSSWEFDQSENSRETLSLWEIEKLSHYGK